ncbi:hypothetical protein ABNB56_07210 [Streptococcus iniae]|uniref:hypothetical protein n=1 Tax=Streptococcus iniae TaxID=1346 RepID=UPI000EFACAD8|nr:hypothetical protein [Streptococcus iniae]RMI79777.1 hypothetical protein DIX58_00850 [Streptococcus iniae]
MKKYRKKPIEVDAIQWTGENIDEMCLFLGSNNLTIERSPTKNHLYFWTSQGMALAKKGDYIIKEIDGEFYPCKEKIFSKTYDKIFE